jgi:hypothetical protein
MQQDPLSDINLTPRPPSQSENPYFQEASRLAREIRNPGEVGDITGGFGEANPYLDFIKQPAAQPAQQPAIGSIASTLSINPDEAAQASKLANQFNLGQDIALRNMQELRHRSLILNLQRSGTLERNPALADWMLNPSNAAMSHDDIDALADTGSWFDIITKGWEGSWRLQEMGELRFSPLSGERFYGATAEQKERIDFVRERMRATQSSGFVYFTAQAIAQQLTQAKGIGTSTLAGAAVGGAIGGPAGAVAGGGIGAVAGVVLTTAQTEAGLIYDELEQEGVDPETATTAAVIGGVINGAIEVAGAKVALAPLKPLIRKLIKDRVESLAMPTMKTALKELGKGYAIQVGTETLEEMTQEITAMTVSELAKAADGIDSETTFKDAVTRITEAAIGGFQGSLILGGIGPGANAIVDVRRAKQTQAQQQWLDGLQERVADVKLRERNPDAFQEFVERQVEGKPVETIYVDAEEAKTVLAQLNLTATQIDEIVPGFSEQVRAELERGGDVTIPTAVFSARLANTDLGNALRPHMRLSPEALSVTQLQAVQQERERMAADGQTAIDERMAQEDTEFVDSANRVEESMFEQLTATGQNATEARSNAVMYRNMMASLANRLGVTPEQMYERFPYQVRGEGQPAAGMEQADQFDQAGDRRTDTPEFQQWFQESKIVDERQQPRVVYHGTNVLEGFTQFVVGPVGEYGRGIYFSTSPETASEYAGTQPGAQVIPAYVSISNPLIANKATFYTDVAAAFGQTREQFMENAMIASREDGTPLEDYTTNTLRSAGYDGVVVNVAPDEQFIVAFDPTQVKSPNNRGTWSRTTPNIMRQASRIDAEYMAAIERGDNGNDDLVALLRNTDPSDRKMELDYWFERNPKAAKLLQQRTEDAARLAGLDKEVWRGDWSNEIWSYPRSRRNEPGIFTTTHRPTAEVYAESGSGEARRFYVGGRTLDLSADTAAARKWLNTWAQEAGWDFVDRTTGESVTPAEALFTRRMWDWEPDGRGSRWKDLQATAKEQGYDIVLLPDTGEYENITSTVVLNENKIKLADPITFDESGAVVPLSRRFDITSPMVFEQAAGPQVFEQRPITPGFYSALERELTALDAKAMAGSGWKERIKGLVGKGAIKAEELEWTGLLDWIDMQEGKVSKDTVLEFVRSNGVKVEEVTLGDRKKMVDQAAIDGSFVAEDNLRESEDGLSPEIETAFNTYRTLIETGASREEIAEQRFIINDALDNAFGTDLDYYIESEYEARTETKYKQYTLPGGTNYREVLLTLPVSPAVKASQQQRYREMVEAGIQLIEAQELATMSADDVQQRILDLQKESEPHAKRVMDFTRFVAPKRKGQTPFELFEWFIDHQIEEQWRGEFNSLMSVLDDGERQWVTNRGYLQSLEQFQAINLRIMNLRDVLRVKQYEARGFQSKHWDQLNVLVHIRLIDRVDADGERVLFVEEVQSDWGQAGRKKGFGSGLTRIIPGPFVETTDGWLNLGLKQIMLEAVNGGYDRVAFVNGQQSANRYKLSERVDSIVYRKNADGTFDFDAIKDSSVPLARTNQTLDDIESELGKEIAQSFADGIGQETEDYGAEYRELTGIQLEVGGKGMKEFYDSIVPAAMNKLLKKYGGGKVGQVAVATERRVTNDEIMAAERRGDFAEAERLTAIMERQELGRGEAPAGAAVIGDQPGFAITPELVKKMESGLPLFQAARGKARGGFDPQKLLTTLNTDADFSTFAHETAHYFLTILAEVASRPDSPQSVIDDMDVLLKWFGVKDLATWNSMTLDQQRQYHEQFAYSFETYLFEGKSPSVELQGLFDQFSRWLKQVYQGLITKINDIYKGEFGTDLPILTGEVRQIMDRMLATDDQIARAQAVREMKPMFQTQEQSGMDDAVWAAYQELQAQATERAVSDLTTATLKEMAWMSRARGRKLRELQQQHDVKRKEIRDEVAQDLRVLPVYRAMEFLKRGKVVDVDGTTKPATGVFKLSADGVKAVMPPEFDVATLGRGRYGMVNADGLHPDLVAPLYGYASGAELVTALSTAKPFNEAVADKTDQRMLAEYGELADSAARQQAVDRAIHNEARARLIAVEQRWAAKLQQPVSVIMEAAGQVAGEIIGRQTLRTLSPRQYAAAEARAARMATSAYSEPQTPEQAGQTAATRAYNAAIADGRTVDEATAASLTAGVEAVAAARERRAEFEKTYGGKSPAEVVMRAKRQQLLQNTLARKALEAQAEIDRAKSAFKRFFGSDEKIGKTRNMEMVSAARAILGWYGFGKRDKNPAEYVDQLKAYNPAAYAALEPLILRATRGPQDYRDLTVDEFRVLRDTVDGLWVQARKDKQVRIADRTMALEEAVGELDARLTEIGVPAVVAGERSAPTFRDRAARQLMTLRSTMRRVESWADAMDGVSTNRPFTTYIVRPVLDAVAEFTKNRNKYMKRFRDLVVALEMPEGTIAAPELNYTFGAGNAGIGKAELLGALLHTGNASNYRKLLLGRGWATEDEFGNLDDSRFKAFVKRMQDEGVLTKSDYDFLQAVWDLNEEIKPIAQKAHYDLYGFYFTEIEATEVATPFGTYRGGYVPAATDKFMVADAATRAGEEELESDWRNSLPSTGAGFTKSRVAGYNKPLSLDVRIVGAHMDAALRFSMIQPAIAQTLRILRSREFVSRLERVDPTVKTELLIPWLNRTARQLVSTPGKYKAIDTFWNTIRTRTGMSIMFANLRNAMQQPTGLFPAALKVQPLFLETALVEYVGSPQRTANSVAALSPFMDDRMKGQVFEIQEQINEVLINPSRFDEVQAWSNRHGYFLQQAFQNMVDVVTWVGAYNQSLSTADTTMTAEEAQREAIADADAAVRLTQGSVRPSDISAFESGTPFFRTMTHFTGYFNMLANLNVTEYVKVIRDMGWRGNKGKLVYIYMMGFMLPAVVADAIVRSLGGGWEDEDEDGYLDTYMDWFFGSQIRQGAAFVPFGSSAFTLLTTAFDDKPYNDRMTTSPSVAALEASTVGVGKAVIAAVDEDKDITGKNVRDVLTLLTVATGIPFSVLGRPAGYLLDVQRGEIEPTSTYDMIRGTITGTATPESKR